MTGIPHTCPAFISRARNVRGVQQLVKDSYAVDEGGGEQKNER